MPRKKKNAPAPDSTERPTTRLIAAEAKVSQATVSMALRNSPLISSQTKARIQKLALKFGYRPDPEISKLMHHLRMRKKPRFKSVIVGLTTLPSNVTDAVSEGYLSRVWSGVMRQSDALGYGADLQRVQEGDFRKVGFWRTLRNRGVEGIVFLPQHGSISLEDMPTWKWFSIVATTHSILTPAFHRVVPDQFGNALLLCQKLEQMGRRRIGMLLNKESDPATAHRFSGAVAWQNTLGNTEPTRPLLYESDFAPALAKWFKRERPDAIIVGTKEYAIRVAELLGLSIPGPVVFAVTDSTVPHALVGIDQYAEEVGSAAVTMLNVQLQSGEVGVPDHPRYTMIHGRLNVAS